MTDCCRKPKQVLTVVPHTYPCKAPQSRSFSWVT